jgi:hypothetical protein
MSFSTSSERAASGAPERPPAPMAATAEASVFSPSPSRAIVVFVSMMPSSPS